MDVFFRELTLFADERSEGAWNMGLDEALLCDSAAPLLRVYGWSRTEFSFGCLMPWAEVRQTVGEQHPLIRRWTGGGIVEHGRDWTYSLMIPSSSPACQWGPAESYCRIHAVLAETLRSAGVNAELRPSGESAAGGRCFERPVTFEVMSGGGKVAGAAQRRSRHGILHQGSVQSVSLPMDFAERFARALSGIVHVLPSPGPQVLARAAELSAEKYGAEAWLRRR
jgi:lipoate-protein ligase A